MAREKFINEFYTSFYLRMIYKSPHIYIFFIFGMKYFPFLNEIGKSFYQGFYFHFY